ncbi:MAG: hypothetical protein ACXW2U_13530 [Telluria sp.]
MKNSLMLLAAVAMSSACSRQQPAAPSTPAPAEKPVLSAVETCG